MNSIKVLLVLLSVLPVLANGQSNPSKGFIPLFDGTFRGWEGDTIHTFRIEDNAIVGGSLSKIVEHNEFLCTRSSYGNFILRLKFKLTGSGFVNAGVQFRSKRAVDPAYEMVGYQADLGDKYWASLYDESRRNRTLAKPDSISLTKILKKDDWNDYEVICQGKNIRIRLNGQETVNYTEKENNIPQEGLIGLQIHGGGRALVRYKDIMVKKLPP
ncbi:MAG: DUF1080 domain-containing protein [Chitinophagaceae bacterium]